MSDRIFVGGGGADYKLPQELLLRLANRHGMIAGATGTGKTVTLQILAEGFSDMGVPVFMADVKGDLSGMAKAGSPDFKLHDKFIERAEKIGFSDYGYDSYPVVFWDLFGKKGHPIRTTVSEVGPLLLSRLLELSDVQEGVLNIAFNIADEQGLLLLDMKDLRSMLTWLGDNAEEVKTRFGNVSTASIGAIQRQLIVLENQGANEFFGEPALQLSDFIQMNGTRGQVNILAADVLMQSPRLYATFLLWLLSELFEQLPEVGDPEKPKFVFFFDEAHLLFDGAPKSLVDKVEQVARLIRSKGVGVYFISQNPDDVPEDILGQLGNRIQHALRAFTPRDQKAIKMAAETFRTNPDFETEDAIKEVGVGEALVSLLDEKGSPSVVQRTLIRPPSSQLGPITDDERAAVISSSRFKGLYDTPVDRQSAYEVLTERAEAERKKIEADEEREKRLEEQEAEYKRAQKLSGSSSRSRSSRSDSTTEALVKSVARAAGSQVGRSIVRGVLGGIFKGR